MRTQECGFRGTRAMGSTCMSWRIWACRSWRAARSLTRSKLAAPAAAAAAGRYATAPPPARACGLRAGACSVGATCCVRSDGRAVLLLRAKEPSMAGMDVQKVYDSVAEHGQFGVAVTCQRTC